MTGSAITSIVIEQMNAAGAPSERSMVWSDFAAGAARVTRRPLLKISVGIGISKNITLLYCK
jgi:hypothetical protein